MGGPPGPWRGGIGRPADDVLGRARHAGPRRDGIGLRAVTSSWCAGNAPAAVAY